MNQWQIALINLVAKVGLDAALAIAKSIHRAPTLAEAIAALENIPTAQAFVDADAAARGIAPKPLPEP